jgi:hypothetical protein
MTVMGLLFPKVFSLVCPCVPSSASRVRPSRLYPNSLRRLRARTLEEQFEGANGLTVYRDLLLLLFYVEPGL